VKPRTKDWRNWHLLAVMVVGCIVEWVGSELRSWAAARLSKRWFEGDGGEA